MGKYRNSRFKKNPYNLYILYNFDYIKYEKIVLFENHLFNYGTEIHPKLNASHYEQDGGLDLQEQ